MLIATFNDTTGWRDKTITFEDEHFILEGHGPVSPNNIMKYDEKGQLEWAGEGMRAWVGSRSQAASHPPAESTRKVDDPQVAEVETELPEEGVIDPYSQIPAKARKVYDANRGSTDVDFIIVGTSSQCLIALTESCIIVKAGFMAGATGGGRFTEFHYSDITGIEVNTGMMSAVLEVTTPAYQGRSKDFWSSGKNEDPWKVSNCLPGSKALFCQGEGAERIEELRRRVRQAKQTSPTVTPAAAVDPAEQIRKLAELREAGVLTLEEFDEAKRRILEAM